ncbi:MAG: hypothetical protein ACR2IN_03140, partial [Thermoleophilaceae bacterium]
QRGVAAAFDRSQRPRHGRAQLPERGGGLLAAARALVGREVVVGNDYTDRVLGPVRSAVSD